MNRMTTALTCAAATVFALSLAAPAQADIPVLEYELSITDVTSGEYREVTLECQPDSGDHPRVKDACDLLYKFDGSIIDAKVDGGGPCTDIHRPVTAEGEGMGETWSGSFPNQCSLVRHKGAIFDF